MNEETIDFGKWNIPTKWDDVSLKMFQDIQRYYADTEKEFDIVEVLHIVLGRSKDEIMQLPTEFLDIILDKLKFLFEKPNDGEPTNKIKIDGETYQINIMEKLKVGEHLAVEMMMKNDKENTAAILAILCRKEGEIFDSKFENEVLPERVKMFEEQPVVNVLPLLSFFINCYTLSVMPSLMSMEVQNVINQERENIMTLHRNGEVSKRTMKSAMKTLKKLEKTISGM